MKITPAGEIAVIHNFVIPTDGAESSATLVQDSNGFLYGAAAAGGKNGRGTVFKCSPAGNFTVIHHFAEFPEGSPSNDVVLGSDGSIYGTTSEGGVNKSGTIFRIDPTGLFSVMYDFEQRVGYLGTTLIRASDDTLYGTSANGGAFGEGFLFKVAPSGIVTTLYSFNGGPGGGSPGALTEGTNGRIYGGTANGGGYDSLGTLFSLSFDATAPLLNISTRMRVQTGNNVLIGGFIITGNTPKEVALRGIGPSLIAFGISDVLANPALELHAANGALMIHNDDWQDDFEQSAQLSARGLALPDPKESGITAPLQPNAYTAILSGENQTTGIGLMEVYDTNQAATSQLSNISTRGFVLAGESVMIGGFILGGSNTTQVAVRGIGPSLSQFGLSPVLADPTLELRDSSGALLIASDNWQDDPVSAAQLAAHGLAPQDSLESGIFTSLPPGAFTAILAGKNGGTGIGLVEIYNLPQ